MRGNVQNWSGSVSFQPSYRAEPGTEAELQELIRDCSRRQRSVRSIGSGHSFTPLIVTDECLLSLDRMQGVIDLDPVTGEAEVWGGTKLWKLSEELFARGRALENLGDIDRQSIAGAISTGTHGTGIEFGGLATQVTELTLVLADGSLRTCSASIDPDLFDAARVSLGSLGVISRLKLRTLPAYRLRLEQRKEHLSDCLEELPTRLAAHRHYEFYYFPYTDTVQSKFVDQYEGREPARSRLDRIGKKIVNDIMIENGALQLVSAIARAAPVSAPWVSRLCAQVVSDAEQVDWSHRIFSSPRHVRFQEIEYALPVEELSGVLIAVAEMIRRRRFAVHFPIECRFARADSIWLSPAYGRDTAYLAAHMYQGMAHAEYFAAVERICLDHGGRPHWAKMHTQTAAALSGLYPFWERFRALRHSLDPDGLFMNEFLETLLGTREEAEDELSSRRRAS